MNWIESTLKRWQAQLTAQLRTLDQPPIVARYANSLPVFSSEERSALLAWVRQRVKQHCDSTEARVSLFQSAKGDPSVNLDVAFWVGGELRSSMILAENLPLSLALERCTERALHDGRFRPLVADELGALRIELTFFGPWEHLESTAREIDFTRGYCACVDGEPRAWYLPMVHNSLHFGTLDQYRESLLYRKGGLNHYEGRRARIYTFPTLGMIESPVPTQPAVTLTGPLVVRDTSPNRVLLLDTTLDWIIRQEITPGVLIAKRIPGQLGTSVIDWPRVAFAGSVLAEAGKWLGRSDCHQAAHRILTFLTRELPGSLGVTPEARALAAIYAGHASLELGETAQAKAWTEVAQRLAQRTHFSPITQLQLAKLLLRGGGAEEAKRDFELLWSTWHRERGHRQLAYYPELLPLALALYQSTHDAVYLHRAEVIGDWYVAQQNTDGSFPFAPGASHLPYVRGSGKILEVLACLPERYAESLERGFGFVARMQYQDDNLYHLRTEEQQLFRGGFRHDISNREAWIDAAGHVVLALVRSRSLS